MLVLIICKFDEDAIKNKGAIVSIILSIWGKCSSLKGK